MKPLAAILLCAGMAALAACGRPASQAEGADAALAPQDARPACRDDSGCGPAQYCAFKPGLCGHGTRPGICRPKPGVCTSSYSPVCGCDGVTYDSECAASAAGVNLAVRGCKAVLPERASCGPRYCDLRKKYCEIYLSDVVDPPTDYFCRPLPASCLPGPGDAGAQPTCDCFPFGTRCRSFCGPMESSGVRGFHLTCQGVGPPREDVGR